MKEVICLNIISSMCSTFNRSSAVDRIILFDIIIRKNLRKNCALQTYSKHVSRNIYTEKTTAAFPNSCWNVNRGTNKRCSDQFYITWDQTKRSGVNRESDDGIVGRFVLLQRTRWLTVCVCMSFLPLSSRPIVLSYFQVEERLNDNKLSLITSIFLPYYQ